MRIGQWSPSVQERCGRDLCRLRQSSPAGISRHVLRPRPPLLVALLVLQFSTTRGLRRAVVAFVLVAQSESVDQSFSFFLVFNTLFLQSSEEIRAQTAVSIQQGHHMTSTVKFNLPDAMEWSHDHENDYSRVASPKSSWSAAFESTWSAHPQAKEGFKRDTGSFDNDTVNNRQYHRNFLTQQFPDEASHERSTVRRHSAAPNDTFFSAMDKRRFADPLEEKSAYLGDSTATPRRVL
jgi:hypothetical protein